MLTNKIKDSIKEQTKAKMNLAMKAGGIKLDRRLITKRPSAEKLETENVQEEDEMS